MHFTNDRIFKKREANFNKNVKHPRFKPPGLKIFSFLYLFFNKASGLYV